MKHIGSALLVLFAMIGSAFAQGGPGGGPGPGPSPNPWIISGSSVTPLSGYKVLANPSTTTQSGFSLPQGSAPTSPVNGDIWTTSAGLFVRINGGTVGPLAAGTTGSFAATSPLTVSAIAGLVTYGFDFTVANTFLAQQTGQGATGTSPGWYAQIAGDTVPRVRVGLNAADVASIGFGSGSATRDTFIERAGPAAVRFGAPDAASPVAQTIGVQNVVAGTTNTAGAALTIAGSQGTGTGLGGSILFKTAPAGSTGSTVNALATVLTLDSTGLATFARSAVLGAPAGGDKGSGTVNAAGLIYSNGNAVAVSASSPLVLNAATGALTCPTCLTGTGGAITANLTTTSGFTAGQFLYSDGSKVQAAGFTGTLGNVVLSASPTLTGTATINAAAIGGATIGTNALAVTGTTLHTGTVTVSSAAAGALAVGANGATNPALTVDASTVSSATGLDIKSAAAGAGLALSVTSSGANEGLAIDAKGSGTIVVGGTSTGAITLTRTVTMNAALTYGGVTLANSVTGTGSMVLSASPTITGHMTVEGVTATGASGTGNFVFATGPSVSGLTVTGSFTATGLVTNASLANPSTTVNGTTCTLGSSCTITATAASITVGTTTVSGGPGVLYNSASGGTLTAVSFVNNAVMVTNGSGVPSFSTTLPSGLAATSLTCTTCTLSGGAATGLTTLAIRDTSAAFDVTLAATSSTTLTAGRTLTLNMGNVAHTLAFGTTANTITFPNLASFTVITNGDTGTVTNTMLAGSIAASKLVGTDIATVGTLTAGAASTGFTVQASNVTWTGTVPSANITAATNAALGVMRGDGTTISCAAGVCQALGAAATSISVGTTTIASGTNGYVLYDNAGVLGLYSSVPVAFGGTGDTGTAWTTYTPTPTSGGGAFTSASSSGSYKTLGKTVWFTITVTITTVGTASGNIIVALPTGTSQRAAVGACKETALTGKNGAFFFGASATTMSINGESAASLIAAGNVVTCTGIYEQQ